MFHYCIRATSDDDRDDPEGTHPIFGVEHRFNLSNDEKPLLSEKRVSFDQEESSRHNSTILLEIVGATGLQNIRANMDTFVVVKVNNKEIHRTKTVPNDYSPIYTVKTKSLCLLKNLVSTDQVLVELCSPNKFVPGSFSCIGSVTLRYDDVMTGQGERREFSFLPDDFMARLSLRYRTATDNDLEYFKSTRNGIFPDGFLSNSPRESTTSDRQALCKDNVSDVDFKSVSKKNILEQQRKTIKVDDGTEVAYRVYPFPDPDNPKETEFMTKNQMDKFMEQPSRDWVEAGGGTYGDVYLEILGCDGLPNMDTEFIDGLTDAFVGCVFEDTFLRTSVIHDSLDPRWPPWSQRAVKLMISHPSSILYLGVFDYDENVLDDHDPIGRVVIHLDDFEPDTMYTLQYPLYNGDTQEETHCGTITIRLRISWKKSIAEVSKAQSFVTPPRFIINCKSQRAWNAVRYLTRGSIDLADPTLDSVKLYANELISHWREYCYLFDVATSIMLWRGVCQCSLFGRRYSVWFPRDSIFLFTVITVAMVYPIYLPSVLFYSIAYGLIVNNYHLSTNPSPWLRTKSVQQIAMTNHGAKTNPIRIATKTGEVESKRLAQVEEYRMHRVTGFIYESMMIALQVYRVYSKNTPVDLSTASSSGGLASKLYKNYLYYLHMMLKYMCTYIRILKNLVYWKSSSTYGLTVKCVLAALTWSIFPYKVESLWLVRILVWTVTGPWIKVVDEIWIRQYYRTREDLLRDGTPDTTEGMKDEIASRPNILEPLLRSTLVETMASTGRVVVEDNVKLRDFREELFGKYTERVPHVDTSRFPSVPLATSFAQPYYCAESGDQRTGAAETDEDYIDLPEENQRWTYVSGQELVGTMIPSSNVSS